MEETMKKYNLWIMLLFTLLLVLGGCSGETGAGSAFPESTQKETDQAGQAESTSQEEAGKEEGGGRPELTLVSKYIYETGEEDQEGTSTVYVKGSYELVGLAKDSASQYPALSEVLDKSSKKKATLYEKEKQKLAKQYKEDPDSKELAPEGFEITNHVYVRRADRKVLSMLETDFNFGGGVHGNFGYSSRNLDVSTGQEISLGEVIADRDLLSSAIKSELKNKYSDADFFDDMESTIDKEVHEDKDDIMEYHPVWTLDPQGITFYFSPYDIGPWAAGSFSVTILYKSGERIFTENYLPEEQEGYICGISLDIPYSFDVDMDDKVDHIEVSTERDEDSYDILKISVSLNDKTLTLDKVYCYEVVPKVVLMPDGRSFLYAWCTGDSDFTNMYIFDLSSGSPVSMGTLALSEGVLSVGDKAETDKETTPDDKAETDRETAPDHKEEGSKEGAADDQDEEDYVVYRSILTDPAHMLLASRFDLLSTYSAQKVYYVADSPVPESKDKLYTIIGETTLVSTKEIAAQKVDEDGKESKEMVNIPAGSSLTLVRTDGEKIVDARLEDGSLVRFTVTGTYPQYINGIDINDLFEQVFFAS